MRVDLSLDMILSPRDGPAVVGGLDVLQEGSEASSSVAGASSSSAAGPSGESARPVCTDSAARTLALPTGTATTVSLTVATTVL